MNCSTPLFLLAVVAFAGQFTTLFGALPLAPTFDPKNAQQSIGEIVLHFLDIADIYIQADKLASFDSYLGLLQPMLDMVKAPNPYKNCIISLLYDHAVLAALGTLEKRNSGLTRVMPTKPADISCTPVHLTELLANTKYPLRPDGSLASYQLYESYLIAGLSSTGLTDKEKACFLANLKAYFKGTTGWAEFIESEGLATAHPLPPLTTAQIEYVSKYINVSKCFLGFLAPPITVDKGGK